jgi:hypothetical protein
LASDKLKTELILFVVAVVDEAAEFAAAGNGKR